jgi:hypothetical protein
MTPQPSRTVDLFVNGRWQPPQAGQYEPAASPVTGERIGQDQGKPLHLEAYPEVDDLIGYWHDAAEDVLRATRSA